MCIDGDSALAGWFWRGVYLWRQSGLALKACVGTLGRMLFFGQPGFEDLLGRELAGVGLDVAEYGGGWSRTVPLPGRSASLDIGRLVFPHGVLFDPVEVVGDSVNVLGARVVDAFLAGAKTERFDGEWPCVFQAAAGLDGLGRRMDGVENVFRESLKKRMGRVAKLATPERPRGQGRVRGLFVWFVDFKRAWVAREAFFNGQCRMADDPLAPSRSYLKIEEAYGVLGREPAEGETVVDLGAAPGGWSYSAAKRGARVIAVDNGPLKGGALNHPLIEHRREDAFRFGLAEGAAPYDWLFCDLVEEPHHVMQDLVAPWLERGWCRRFVVILKFGRVDATALIQQLMRSEGVLARCAPGFRVRHLFHDREELTIVGDVAARRG